LPFVIPLTIALPWPVAGAAAAAALLFILWFRRFLLLHLGGVTGDCLGFGVYTGQLLILLAAAASLP
jgi:adenosylcobinamide-GDP ribazoletransferase